MAEADIEIDLTDNFGYQHVSVRPSQVLGTGSYGNVVKAMLDDLPCAAKILHRNFFTSNDPGAVNFTRRFEQECRILRDLKHPCIVQFLGFIEDPHNRRPILLMELMEESLTDYLESSPIPLPYHVQVNLTHDISQALAYLHANSILHRDLSSNNILLIAGTRAKLTDFGMSKIVDINPRMTRNKQTMCPGTLAFMPPEALLTPPSYSDKIDVFSTGVLAIQIATRKYPNPGDPHNIVEDPRYGRILVPIPELERRKGDLLGVYLTHPLRPIACDCLMDRDRERPTAADLCQRLVGLMATAEYAASVLESRQQVLALPPTKTSHEMRDREIEELDQQHEALTREKREGKMSEKEIEKIDEELAELRQRKQPLVTQREKEEEAERQKMEYEGENTALKKCVEEQEKRVQEQEKRVQELEQALQAHMLQKGPQDATEEVDNGDDIQGALRKKQQRSMSLPSLKIVCPSGDDDKKMLSDAEQRKLGAKVLRLHFSELYQHLNAASLLGQLVERKIITPEKRKEIEKYTHKYAQNHLTTSALFIHPITPAVALDLCEILDRYPDCAAIAAILRSDFERQKSNKISRPISAVVSHDQPSNFSDLQSRFFQMLNEVMNAFDRLPNSLNRLQQFLSQLALPLGEGKVASLVDPSRYENAVTPREVFRQLSVLWNGFSPHLLKLLCQETQCSVAMATVEEFLQYCSQLGSSLICRRTQSLDKPSASQNTTATSPPLHPSHLTYHTGPIDALQSLHPSVFHRLNEHQRVLPRDTIRLTVQVDRPHLTLLDYDNVTTAVCGYFSIPRAALVYAGCSPDSMVVCWMLSAGLLPYLKSVGVGRSAQRLMAEQGIVGVAAGDLHYRCMQMKEVELHEAALYGLVKRVKILLQQNAPVDARNKGGATALHMAAQEGKVDVVRLLSEAGAQLNIQTEDGQTAFYISCWKGHLAVVQLLLQKHADVSICKKNGWTPLMTASFGGHVEVVRILIGSQAQLNTQQENGATALHCAAQEGKVDVVRLLTEAGAQLNIQNEDGQTAFYVACQSGHVAVVQLLLQKHADVSICNKNGMTPLMTASFGGHVEVVRILIGSQAQLNTQQENGATALHCAAQEGKVDVVRLLTEAGAQLNIQMKDGGTALHKAAQEGKVDVVRLLTEAGAQLNIQTETGETALYISCWKGHVAVVQLLLQKHADVSICSKNGATPLYIASEYGHTDVVDTLIRAGVSVNQACMNGRSIPLAIAAHEGHLDTVKRLVEEGSNINHQNKGGGTPLYSASSKGHTDVVDTLIRAGANIDLVATDGRKPIDIARTNGHPDIVRLLEETSKT